MSRVLLNAENQITDSFGNNHNGVDVVKKTNQLDTIIAHSDGLVILTQKGLTNEKGSTGTRSYGNYVKIKHDNGYYTLYAHLKDVYVNKGVRVKKGEKIGFMGDSGNAYGAHLHFEVRDINNKVINPTYYLDHDLPNVTRGITYQSYDNKKRIWLPNVNIGTNEYAGNFGNAMGGVYLDTYEMRVHDKVKNEWLPWVKNRNDYAGNLGNAIDGVQIKDVTYRVHLKNCSWLPWVNKVDNTPEGYAGIYGIEIDALQIK